MDIRTAMLALGTAFIMALGSPALAQSSQVTDHVLRADAPVTPPASVAASVPTGHDSHYVIGSDDVLSVSVWKEPDLTQDKIPVRSDGNISIPLIGEVHASGLTPRQLEQDIATKLRTYLTAPDVTVVVVEMNSQKFNILGRVVKPGSYKLTAATTVLDAIAQAGGFQDFAKKGRIYILRDTPDGKQTRIPFNYKTVIRGEHPEENVRLDPGDTIVVP